MESKRDCFQIGMTLLLSILILPGTILGMPVEEPSPEGIWTGTLKVSAIELRLVFIISAGEDGALSGTMDSIDQGANDIPVSEVTRSDGKVKFTVPSVIGYFEGEFNEDGTVLEGEWNQGGMAMPLKLERQEKVPELNRPQEPKEPYPYNSEDITFENKEGGITLVRRRSRVRVSSSLPFFCKDLRPIEKSGVFLLYAN